MPSKKTTNPSTEILPSGSIPLGAGVQLSGAIDGALIMGGINLQQQDEAQLRVTIRESKKRLKAIADAETDVLDELTAASNRAEEARKAAIEAVDTSTYTQAIDAAMSHLRSLGFSIAGSIKVDGDRSRSAETIAVVSTLKFGESVHSREDKTASINIAMPDALRNAIVVKEDAKAAQQLQQQVVNEARSLAADTKQLEADGRHSLDLRILSRSADPEDRAKAMNDVAGEVVRQAEERLAKIKSKRGGQ